MVVPARPDIWRFSESRAKKWSGLTCAGLQLSCLTLYRRAEKPKMVSTPTSSPIYGLRPQIRGWSVISTEPGLYWHLCKGWSMYLKGAGGGFAQVALMGGEIHPPGSLITCFWEEGHRVQMVCMHHQHDQGRGPWILLHVASGPWTSFVAVLDKVQWNIAVCRRHMNSLRLWYLIVNFFHASMKFLTVHILKIIPVEALKGDFEPEKRFSNPPSVLKYHTGSHLGQVHLPGFSPASEGRTLEKIHRWQRGKTVQKLWCDFRNNPFIKKSGGRRKKNISTRVKLRLNLLSCTGAKVTESKHRENCTENGFYRERSGRSSCDSVPLNC